MSSDSQRKLDDERRQFAEKREAVTDWEEQIKEIIQWLVSSLITVFPTLIISLISFNCLVDFSRQSVAVLYTQQITAVFKPFFLRKCVLLRLVYGLVFMERTDFPVSSPGLS